MNNLYALKHYSQDYIYKLITIRYPNLTDEEKRLKIQITFKQLINIIKDLSATVELDKYNTPMAFLFQHLKDDIIQLVANCVSTDNHIYIQRKLIYNLDWNKRFFQCLVELNAIDIIIWYFLHIPYYIPDINTLENTRNIYEQILDYFLESWPANLYISETEFTYASNETCMPYAITYHNKNNVVILKKYCSLLRKICPWLNYYSPKVAEYVLKTRNGGMGVRRYKKRKICFITDSFSTDSSVLRDRIGIIGKLDSNSFDVFIASFIPEQNYNGVLAATFITKFKNQYIHLGANLTDARTILEKYNFDIIIYPDLGMKLLPTLLAYSRIAPIQITTWGHSETSGIDTVDYYVSSRWFENSNLLESNSNREKNSWEKSSWEKKIISQYSEKYSEQLILFKSLGTYYFSPNLIFIDTNPHLSVDGYKMKTRGELGFLENVNIYCCMQTFYKINAEFEKCLSRILDLDQRGIILLSNSMPYCKSHLLRIQSILGDEKIKRLKWYPSLEKHIFLNLVAISDVVLDPFPFGGCNTTFEAFDYNIPVITWPSEYLHGRFTLGLYKKMGMEDCECITGNSEEYAQVATRIAMNIKLRHKLNRTIEEGKTQIFQERESVDEWNQFLTAIN